MHAVWRAAAVALLCVLTSTGTMAVANAAETPDSAFSRIGIPLPEGTPEYTRAYINCVRDYLMNNSKKVSSLRGKKLKQLGVGISRMCEARAKGTEDGTVAAAAISSQSSYSKPEPVSSQPDKTASYPGWRFDGWLWYPSDQSAHADMQPFTTPAPWDSTVLVEWWWSGDGGWTPVTL